MNLKVISMYQKKKETGRRIMMTDEWLDRLAEEYMAANPEEKKEMTFVQWVEYKTVRFY